uniref:Uncharacterized protein n=1 Tax=Tanacetum cinerariifolium TaxID=118510 RepID=A0A699GVZ5_TANCI|nr:hypothetical protein [Tanacetum cinerariifolium]
MGSFISMVSISPEGFLPSILLLVVVIVMVVIIAVILVVVVVAIDGVVIVVMIIGVEVMVMIIGVVVSLRFRGGNISFDTSSQMVKFVFRLLDLSPGIVLLYHKLLEFNPVASFTLQASVQLLREKTDFARSNQWISLTAPSEPLKLKGYNGNFWNLRLPKIGGDVADLTGNEDPTNKDGDTGMGDLTGVSVSLGGEIFSEEKKS